MKSEELPTKNCNNCQFTYTIDNYPRCLKCTSMDNGHDEFYLWQKLTLDMNCNKCKWLRINLRVPLIESREVLFVRRQLLEAEDNRWGDKEPTLAIDVFHVTEIKRGKPEK